MCRLQTPSRAASSRIRTPKTRPRDPARTPRRSSRCRRARALNPRRCRRSISKSRAARKTWTSNQVPRAGLRGQQQAARQGGPHHGRRFGHRPCGGGAVRARRRRHGDPVPERARRCSRDEALRGKRRAPLPGDLRRREGCQSLHRRGGANGEGIQPTRYSGEQRRFPGTRRVAGRSLRRALRRNVSHERIRLLSYGKGGAAAYEEGASIINTGSVTGLEGSSHLLDYSATKGAIHAFTKALAQNLLERGIRVNAVAPGPVWTPLNPADSPAQKMKEFGKSSDMKRAAQPEELSPAYVFLAAPVCSGFITGIVLPITGSVSAI